MDRIRGWVVTVRDDDDVEGRGEGIVLPGVVTAAQGRRHAVAQALLSLEAARAGVAVAALLAGEVTAAGARPPDDVAANALVGARAPARAAEEAEAALAAGFETVKIKVGADLEEDLARVQAVRAVVGREVELRVDANGGWTRRQAARAVGELAELGVSILEQPVDRRDLDGLATLRGLASVLIAADESVAGLGSVRELVEAGAVDAIVCKPMRLGGPRAAAAVARTAIEAGLAVIVTTSLEGAVGRAGAVAVAAAVDALVIERGGTPRAHGLATGALLEGERDAALARAIAPRMGRIVVPTGSRRPDLPDAFAPCDNEMRGPPRTTVGVTRRRVPGGAPGSRWTGPASGSIVTRLLEQAERRGRSPAVSWRSGALTWGELADHALRAAGALAAAGSVAGERVGLLGGNEPGFVVGFHAILLAGATVVPLPRPAPAASQAALLRRAGARLVLHAPGDRTAAARLALASGVRVVSTEVFGAAASPRRPSLEPTGPATVLFTSGTTGAPRGIVLEHAHHLASAAASARRLGTGADDSWLVCLPIFHTAGVAALVRSVHDGFPVVLREGFDPDETVADLRRYRRFSLVGRALDRVLERRGLPARGAIAARTILIGGGPAAAATMGRALDRGLPVVRTYGLTEAASQVATQTVGSRDESCGRPLDGVEVRIDRVEPDGLGTILVRGPQVARVDLDGARVVDAAGWLRTGDLGRLDALGQLVVVDRRTDRIVTGGETVAPAPIEDALAGHPDVVEAAAVGLADPSWGRRVVAVVRVAPGAVVSDEELSARCARALPAWACPREIIRADRPLPRTALGKLRRDEVRRALAVEG